MFGLTKKVRKDEELIMCWGDLVDLLIGVGDGTHCKDGSVRFDVPFKKEKRTAQVFVHCAEVDGIGAVLYFTAPVTYQGSPEICMLCLDMVEKILEGGIVVTVESVAVRTTKPMTCMTYRDVSRLVERLAVTADEFAKTLP